MNNINYSKINQLIQNIEVLNRNLLNDEIYFDVNLFKKMIFELNRLKRYYENNNLLVKFKPTETELIDKNKINEIYSMLEKLVDHHKLDV